MSRNINTLPAFTDPTYVTITNFWTPNKNNQDLLALGSIMRNVFMGGSHNQGMDASLVGDIIIPEWRPILVDNSGNQVSSSPSVVIQARFMVRVSDPAISVTPKIYNLTAIADATISGESACSATDDDYSGTGQQQTVALTLPSGINQFQARVEITGSPAPGFQAWAAVMFDCYVNL